MNYCPNCGHPEPGEVCENCNEDISSYYQPDGSGWKVEVKDQQYIIIKMEGRPGFIQIKNDDEGFILDIFANEVQNKSVASTFATFDELEELSNEAAESMDKFIAATLDAKAMLDVYKTYESHVKNFSFESILSGEFVKIRIDVVKFSYGGKETSVCLPVINAETEELIYISNIFHESLQSDEVLLKNKNGYELIPEIMMKAGVIMPNVVRHVSVEGADSPVYKLSEKALEMMSSFSAIPDEVKSHFMVPHDFVSSNEREFSAGKQLGDDEILMELSMNTVISLNGEKLKPIVDGIAKAMSGLFSSQGYIMESNARVKTNPVVEINVNGKKDSLSKELEKMKSEHKGSKTPASSVITPGNPSGKLH